MWQAFLFDLLHHDISTINLREIPRTEALLDQIINSMNSVEKFWFIPTTITQVGSQRMRSMNILKPD
jgi:hypothetical protein